MQASGALRAHPGFKQETFSPISWGQYIGHALSGIWRGKRWVACAHGKEPDQFLGATLETLQAQYHFPKEDLLKLAQAKHERESIQIFEQIVSKKARRFRRKRHLFDGTADFALLAKLPARLHGLNKEELYTVARAASLELQSGGETPRYLPRGYKGLPRALVIDYQRGAFFILCKKAGSIFEIGTQKKASDAIEIGHTKRGRPYAGRFVRLVNRQGETISERELLLDELFNGKNRLLFWHTSKRGQCKVSIITKAYASTLKPYTRSGKLSLQAIEHAITGVYKTLRKMHHAGYIHNDVKPENVLVKRNEVKLNDFGLTYRAYGEKKSHFGYGTSSYTSCEHLDPHTNQPLSDPLEQGKADDLYALGSILWELLHPGRERPWAQLVAQACSLSTSGPHAALLQRRAYNQLLTEAEACTDVQRKKLLWRCARLMHPNPALRSW